MKKMRLIATAITALSLIGCQSLEHATGVAAPDVNVADNAIVTNGMFAQVVVRLRGMEGIIKDVTNQKICIQQLQRVQIWPRGIYQPNAILTAKTLLQVELLLVQRQEASSNSDAALERGSEVIVKIYDIGVGPDDTIEKTAVVDKNGDITLPMIRKVHVAGLPASDAAEKIRQTYIDKGYYRDLTVDVSGEVGSLFVSGEGIKTPGRVDFKGGMTLSELIISSGGFDEWAKRDRVKIIRNTKTSYHDYDDIQEGKEIDPILKPGDKVFVERRSI